MDVDELTIDAYPLEQLDFMRKDNKNDGEATERKASIRKASVHVAAMDNRLILIAASISFCRTDAHRADEHISQHHRYHAAQVVSAIYVKDGKVVEFKPENSGAKNIAKVATEGAIVTKWDPD